MADFKSMPQFVKEVQGRTVTGICAVFGNVDLGGDRLWPGAFTKTIQESRGRVKHLWNHGQDGWDYFCTPPIATIRELKEVGRAELPQSVLDFAPEASGGLQVTREYLETERGNEVLEAITKGAGLEMSFGYDPIKWEYKTENSGTLTEYRVRELREVKLYDTSDVLFGMNPATSADGKRADSLFSRVEALVKEFRGGKAELLPDVERLRSLLAQLTDDEGQRKAEGQSRADAYRASLTQNLRELAELELSLR